MCNPLSGAWWKPQCSHSLNWFTHTLGHFCVVTSYIWAISLFIVSTLSAPKGSNDFREHYLGLLYPSEQYKVYPPFVKLIKSLFGKHTLCILGDVRVIRGISLPHCPCKERRLVSAQYNSLTIIFSDYHSHQVY